MALLQFTNRLNCVLEHKANLVDGPIGLYAIHDRLHCECFEQAGSALQRDSELGKTSRNLRLDFIQRHNPDRRDLYEDIVS